MKKLIVLVILFVTLAVVVTNTLQDTKKNILDEAKEHKFNQKIEYNVENSKKLDKFLYDKIVENIDKLGPKKMDYDSWIEYLNKNEAVEYENNKYYIYVYQLIGKKGDSKNKFLVKVAPDEDILEESFADYLNKNKSLLLSSNFDTDPEIINNMFVFKPSGMEYMQYNWTVRDKDIETETDNNYVPVKKHAIYKVFDDERGRTGVMVVGYNIKNLKLSTEEISYDLIDKKLYYCALFSIFLVSFFLYILSPNKNLTNSILYMLLMFYYIYNYLSSVQLPESYDIEIKKVESINSGMLSLTFLIGIITFVLKAFEGKKSYGVHFSGMIIYSIALLFLISSIFKKSNYETLEELITVRVNQEFIFNYTLLVNGILMLYYIIYIIRNVNPKHINEKFIKNLFLNKKK
jgi:hypothetical protein